MYIKSIVDRVLINYGSTINLCSCLKQARGLLGTTA